MNTDSQLSNTQGMFCMCELDKGLSSIKAKLSLVMNESLPCILR